MAAFPGIAQGIHEVVDPKPQRIIETIFRQPELHDPRAAEACVIGGTGDFRCDKISGAMASNDWNRRIK